MAETDPVDADFAAEAEPVVAAGSVVEAEAVPDAEPVVRVDTVVVVEPPIVVEPAVIVEPAGKEAGDVAVDSVVVVFGTLGVVSSVEIGVVLTAAVVLVASPANDSDTGALLARAVAVVEWTGLSVKGFGLTVIETSWRTVDGEPPAVVVDRLAVFVVGDVTGSVLAVLDPARVVSVLEELGVVTVSL